MDAISVEAWVKFNSLRAIAGSGVYADAILVQRNWWHDKTGFSLRTNGTELGNNRFEFSVQDGINLHGGIVRGPFAETNKWYHLAGTYDGRFVKLYVNGELWDRTAWSGAIPINNDQPIWMGSDNINGGQTNGRIDEVAIYDRALAAEEIKAIYDAASLGKIKPSELAPTTGPTPTALPTPALQSSPNPTPARSRVEDVRVAELPPRSPALALEMAIRSAESDPGATFALAALRASANRAPTLQDDFSDPASGFGESQGAVSYNRYEDGQYLMATHPDSPCCFGPSARGDYTDLVAQLDMRLEPFSNDIPRWGSLALRRTQLDGFYIFDLSYNDGQMAYSLGANKIREYIRFEGGLLATASQTGLETWHNMIVVLVGNQIAYFVDGVLVATLTDDDLTHGGFNMYAGWGTEVSIDNFRLWDISE